jgi:hypothetical protein
MTNEPLDLNVLPESQLLLWEELSATPPEFVLYGGTAIALQLGHRESIDFDFFCHKVFDPQKLYDSIEYLSGSEIVGLDRNTLTCLIQRGGGHVQCSFFGGLSMQCIEPPIHASNGIKIAPLLDLLASKCSTVQQRAEWKDYTDIATILDKTDISLSEGIGAACAIFGEKFNPMTSLKALVYTKDLKPELRSDQERLIRDQVVEAELGGFPAYQPAGSIGSIVKSPTTPSGSGPTP